MKNMKIKKTYFASLQMRNALLRIEKQMDEDGFAPDIVLGINRGGCIPGVYMSHRLDIPHEVLDVRLRDHQAKPDLRVLEKAYAFQKKILIIDDINDSGATLNHIEANFGKGDGRIKFACLVHNKPSKAHVDWYGYEIDKSKDPSWIVFPWEEWSGNKIDTPKLIESYEQMDLFN
jgi:hypoxanthine phosphoribosyltransferase|tara:strand:- start:678 stop:1202 length:525 start_codon:yes stop_codon:yes gene_type:complete